MRMLMLALVLSGCGGQASTGSNEATAIAHGKDVTVTSSFDAAQVIRGVNDAELQVADATGVPVDEAEVSVSLFMPAHGHGASVNPTITPQGGGRYRAENIVCTMPGMWQMTVHVVRGALDDTAVFDLDIP